MRLNGLSPAWGARRERRRVGRGAGSGLGKTGGRGHKGQKSRSGGGPRRGFEGGQTPLHRRLPKFGFTRRSPTRVVRLEDLVRDADPEIDLPSLRRRGLVGRRIRSVKVILPGEVSSAFVLRGLRISRGARAKVEAGGGKVEGRRGGR